MTLTYPTAFSLGFILANSSISLSLYRTLIAARSDSSALNRSCGNGGLTCSFFVRRWARALK